MVCSTGSDEVHFELFRKTKGGDCCIRCGPDEERILDVVPREDGARNSG